MEDKSYERYCEFRDMKGYTDYKVAKETGIGTATMSNWKNGKYVPKLDKLKKIADFLGISEKAITGGDSEQGEIYYQDKETAEIAQALFENKELRVLFDVAKDAKADDIIATYHMLLALKRKEREINDI